MLSSCAFSEKAHIMLGELTFRTGFYFGGFYFYPRKRMDAPRREENG